jgi:hypothetical protein
LESNLHYSEKKRGHLVALFEKNEDDPTVKQDKPSWRLHLPKTNFPRKFAMTLSLK